MSRKQDWEVTIIVVETEGCETTTKPWYSGNDVREIIQNHLHRAGPMIDLKVRSVVASESGDHYSDADGVTF